MIIEVDNYRVPWFASFDITTSIASIADNAFFVTRLYDELLINKEINVWLDEDLPLFKGYLDRMSPSTTMGKWQSRSITSALVDSCPIVTTGEFRNRNTFQIIEALASPFGIGVEGEEGVLFDKFNVELDSTCDSIIAELCIYSGLIASTTPEGKLQLIKHTPEFTPDVSVSIEEGINCNIMFSVDSRKMASEYQVLGQGSFLSGNNTQIEASQTSRFPGIKKACIISDAITNNSFAKQQVDWIRRGYDASAENLVVTIPKIRNIFKGQYASVTSERCKLQNAKRLIEKVRYVQKEDSLSYTELTLVPPSKYGGEEVELSGWLL